MRVAVIGAKGSAGQRHCAAFQAEGCEVVEIDKGDKWVQADAYSLATPDNLHEEHFCSLSFLGVHVFCEKPLAHDMKALRHMEEDLYLRPKMTFSCNLPLRHSAKAAAIVPGAWWGQYVWGRPAKWGGWRGDIENYSIAAGGGIHLIDLLMSKFGEARAIRSVRDFRRMWAGLIFDDASLDLWLDFQSSGDHKVTLAGYDGIIEFDEPNDFRAPIHEFLEDIKAGRPGNGLEAIAANRVCLQIEEAAK